GLDRAAGASVRGAGNAPRPGGREPAPEASEESSSGYDPATGLVLGADGRPLQFGGTGGQYRTAGDQSWKQLLLAGVTP
ncbi:ABC transporter substrate-binding protein, partial [Micromonospora globispora]